MNKLLVTLLLLFAPASAMQQKRVSSFDPEKIATFRAVQKIYEYAKETAQELKNICELTLPNTLELDPENGQTQQGLRLLVRGYPRFVESPWGLVTIFTSAAHHNPHCFDTPTQTLLKKIDSSDTLALEKLSSWPYKETNDAQLKDTPITRRNLELDFDHKILKKLQRTKDYLKENPGNAYAIDSVNNEPCPRARALSRELYRDTQVIILEWQVLQKLADNNYRQTTPPSTKSPKTTRQAPKMLATPPLLAILPTGDPSDPLSPKSPIQQKQVSTPPPQKLSTSPYTYGSFSSATSPLQSPSSKEKPYSPEEQEYSRLLPESEPHTPESNCSCKCSLM